MVASEGINVPFIMGRLTHLRKSGNVKQWPANSDRKWYLPHPCLSEAEVLRFEQKHNVHLPEEYRDFLVRIGNGGAGGIFPVGVQSEGYAYDPEWPDEHEDIGYSLEQPFPHRQAWNLTPPEEDAEEWLDDEYFNDKHVFGSFRIFHNGCAIYHLLVVTGPEQGRIWCDSRTDMRGIYPLGMRFSQWLHSHIIDRLS